jgi:hypothetical protein
MLSMGMCSVYNALFRIFILLGSYQKASQSRLHGLA